jgi:hypothetical protein
MPIAVQKTKTKHPYFSSWQYQQTRLISDKRLIALGYTANERKHILHKCDLEIMRMLREGEMIYIKGVGVFCRKEVS